MTSMSLLLRSLALAALICAATAATAGAATVPWPPAEGSGHLFVHYGEEHWNDDDGATLLPKIIEDSARYRPALVTLSGDKANDGTVDQLTKWREYMSAYDRAGVPYFAAVGNHDRLNAPANQPGFPPGGSTTNYLDVFAERPWPMGDAKPYDDPNFVQRERPAQDPPGAATHYSLDYGNVRWIFVDNSCWDITFCSTNGQNPADADTRSQLAWLESRALEATNTDKVVFVVMHMGTRDPRDQSYVDPTSVNHAMGKGASPTNDIAEFERIVSESGVDGVFVGHIKGQFQYVARNVPYYIDGGAGGELYTEGPVGTDHGYWHGYRLLRVTGRNVITDSVPIFVPGTVTVSGPDSLAPGAAGQFEAFGTQPVFNDPAKVPALELRDPDPVPREGVGAGGVPPALVFGSPFLVFLLLGVVMSRPRPRRRLATAAVPAMAGLVAITGIAIAQRSEPTSTPKDSLPNPARIWTSSNPHVLAPSPSGTEDPRRDPATQTHDGKFRAGCPGRATVRITSGWETKGRRVTVPSAAGAHLRSLSPRAKTVRAGKGTTLAKLRLAQRAEVEVRVLRGRKRVATPLHRCLTTGRSYGIRWDGRTGKKLAKPGAYRVEVIVRSERSPVVRRLAFRVR
jgi:hypothetical protein